MPGKSNNSFLARRYSKSRNDSPEAAGQRLIRVYELAIDAARRENAWGVRHCLGLLRHTLDPAADPNIALTLSELYTDCEQIIALKDFGQLMEILEHVKGLWIARMKLDSLQRG